MSLASFRRPGGYRSQSARLLRKQIEYWEQCYVDCFIDGADYGTLKAVYLQIKALKAQLHLLVGNSLSGK